MVINPKIFLLWVDVENSCMFVNPNAEDKYQDIKGKLPEMWRLPTHTISPKRLPLRDFISSIDLEIFVSEYAYSCLFSLLGEHAEFRKIGKLRGKGKLGGSDYYFMNVLTEVDCLDIELSQIRTNHVHSFVFVPDKIPETPIFKIPQDRNRVFVTNPFIEVIRKNRISGVGFSDPAIPGHAWQEPFFEDLPIFD